MKRGIVYVDVDGVLADFATSLVEIARDPVRRIVADLTDWYFIKDFCPEARQRALEALETEEFWANLKPIEYAQLGIKLLRADRYEVILVTTPWYACANWDSLRRDWCLQHFNVLPDDIITTKHKHLLHGLTLIDDRPCNIQHWSQGAGVYQGLLYNQPYNRYVDPIFEYQRFNWHQYLQEGDLHYFLQGLEARGPR